MISKKRFVNKLKELGYVFKDRLHFSEVYRKKGGTHIIHVPISNQLEDAYVGNQLRQVGLSKDEVAKFISEATT